MVKLFRLSSYPFVAGYLQRRAAACPAEQFYHETAFHNPEVGHVTKANKTFRGGVSSSGSDLAVDEDDNDQLWNWRLVDVE